MVATFRGMSVMVAVVWVLAVARVTRLVNQDVVFDPVRLWVASRVRGAGDAAAAAEVLDRVGAGRVWRRGERRWLTVEYFLSCPWCVSVWVAGVSAWVPLWFAGNAVAVYVGVVLAASYVVGVAAELLNDEDVAIEEVEV